jgi:multidrug efflux pump subunit AcrB
MKVALSGLRNSLLTGILLALVILFIFMKDIRSALIISVSIPTAMVISLSGIYLSGLSLNIISISGLILSLGMMTDTSLIIIDNIRQYQKRNITKQEYVIYGTSEVIKPLLTSSITTCAVFIPLILVSDTAGEFFKEEAVTVTIGIAASLFTGVLFIPVLYNSLQRSNELIPVSSRNTFHIGYENGLKTILAAPFRSIITFLLLVPISYFLFKTIRKSTFPATHRDEYHVYIEWDKSVSLKQNEKKTLKLSGKLEKFIPVMSVYCGKQNIVLDPDLPGEDNISLLVIETKNAIDEIEKIIGRCLQDEFPRPGVQVTKAKSIFDRIFRVYEDELIVAVKEPEIHQEELKAFLEKINMNYSTQDVTMLNNNHFEYVPDINKLTLYNISEDLIDKELKLATEGILLSDIFDCQVLLFMNPLDGNFYNHIMKRNVENRSGEVMPLCQLVTKRITKRHEKIIAGIAGTKLEIPVVVENRMIGDIIEDISESAAINELEVDFIGNHFESKILLSEIYVSLLISVGLLYFIVAAQFESLLQPLIIISEIMIDLSGVFLFHIILGESFNVISGIGIIVMAGIIINDSILKVDTINKEYRMKQELNESIIIGGRRRLNPIVMTSVTTILALLPLLFTGGIGAILQRPLAISVIGGLLIGTFASIYYIPLAYLCLSRIRMIIARLLISLARE